METSIVDSNGTGIDKAGAVKVEGICKCPETRPYIVSDINEIFVSSFIIFCYSHNKDTGNSLLTYLLEEKMFSIANVEENMPGQSNDIT